MKLYINGFWSNFLDENSPTNITYFITLFQEVFNENIEIGNIEESEILLETIFFESTMIKYKKWKHTFLYSGESRLTSNYKDYDCVLCCQRTHDNIINLPLFMINMFCYKLNFKDKIVNVPKKDIICIISNDAGKERNSILNKLDKYFKIDYYGSYKNNMNKINDCYNSVEFMNIVSEYKFIISMENSRTDTYITEKILHGFYAGNISIYWGSLNVCNYFNSERFININDHINDHYIHSTINKIKDIIDNKELYLEIVNKNIMNNVMNNRNIKSISNEIKNLIFKNMRLFDVENIFVITNEIFEPERYKRINNLFSELQINNYKCICPTYNYTITDEMMNKYVTNNLVKNIRYLGMKKSEMSLILNYKSVLEYILNNYKDGIFLIFESDVYIKNNDLIHELNIMIKELKNNREKWDLIHIGQGGE